MRIFTIESQKGGSGKTTIAVHLAQAFSAGGYQTLLLDLDPQTSAAEWKDARAMESPAVMAVPSNRRVYKDLCKRTPHQIRRTEWRSKRN
jgi:chromosome partitioning protein